MNFKTLIGCALLAAPLGAASEPLQCTPQRVYEGDPIHCIMSDFGQFTFRWSILGKELKREMVNVTAIKTAPRTVFITPAGLKQVTPLDLEVRFKDINGGIREIKDTFNLYPRDAGFYISPDVTRGKRIAVNDPSGKLKKELDFFNIRYDDVSLADMPPKRYELLILGRPNDIVDDLVPANEAPVVQLNVDTHLDDDPQTRWLLAQRIRAVFKSQNDAKDLAGSQSN